MNKSELIDAVSGDSGLTKTDTERVINSFIAVTQKALKKRDDVSIVGFGSFFVKDTAGRSGRDFKTGAPISIPPGKSVRFKAGKNLKDAVN
ncbi:MAG: HU family DNA-binding protein [Holosporaceae bacterium]|jgi:DNA-binding protein HU-beta|nr:HU family DNA-binding protein [Holosporaceae bacterium]